MKASQVIAQVALKHGLGHKDITGRRQHPRFVQARREVARILRSQCWSLPQIGFALGGRDHSTIDYYLRNEPKLSPVIPVPDLSGEWAI